MIDKLLTIASHKLKDYDLNLEEPIAILGDASASMDIAIKTSSIVVSVICSLCNADMLLFNNKVTQIEDPPKNAKTALDFIESCHALCCTAPVLTINKYLLEKKVVKTFIIISDEEENTGLKG